MADVRAPTKRPLPSPQRGRTALALLGATAIVSLALTVLMAALTVGFGEVPLAQVFARIGSVLLFVALILGAVAMTFVLAWHSLAFRMRWRSAPSYLGAGVSIGALSLVPAFYFFVQPSIIVESGESIVDAGLGIGLGYFILCIVPCILLTWVFWLLRRPDRDIDRDAPLAFE